VRTVVVARSNGSGRQPALVEQLRDLREELVAERAEGVLLAERVRVGADRIVAAATVGSRMAIVNEAGKLGYHASRFLRQRAGL
jgi:hypothetical protein